jgi:signal transduction histidine kinase
VSLPLHNRKLINSIFIFALLILGLLLISTVRLNYSKKSQLGVNQSSEVVGNIHEISTLKIRQDHLYNFIYAGSFLSLIVIAFALVLINIYINRKNIENDEKEKRAAELAIANTELIFQNDEKEKRAAELAIANTELIFQNDEKEKRAAELAIANTELIFQNDEKEKRAAELAIANKELIFQNDEKEKRAAELAIANKEIFLQNEEKIRQEYDLSIASLLDIEKQKRNEELMVANKKLIAKNIETEKLATELESFNYSISHDLSAPLHSIATFSQIIFDDHDQTLSLVSQDALGRVMNNAKTIGQVIEGLLELSHITTIEIVRNRVNLSLLVEVIATELQGRTPDRAVDFIIAKNIMADGDPNILSIIMNNLMRNSYKFTSKKTKAIIEFGIDNEIYFLRDNGAGFDMRHKNKLFGSFERLHTVHEFPGTGIGLATVLRGIRRHQGLIWAEAEVDKGATFYFTLGK